MRAGFFTSYEGKTVVARRINQGYWPPVYEVENPTTHRRSRVTVSTRLENDPDQN